MTSRAENPCSASICQLPFRRDEQGPARQPACGSRPLRLTRAGGGVGDGRRGAPRRPRRARRQAGADGRGRRAVAVDEAPRYVSRGGIKLENALDALGGRRRPAGAVSTSAPRRAASPTACSSAAPEHVVGARRRLRRARLVAARRSRVTVLERGNARALTAGRAAVRAGPRRRRRVVHLADEGAAGRARVLRAERFDALAMVKPQFEVGRGRVGKGGVVRDRAMRAERSPRSPSSPRAELRRGRARVRASGLPGPKGNLETFVHLAEAGRAGALARSRARRRAEAAA